MTIFAKNLHSMKRFRIFAIIFMMLLFVSLPLSVSGQTVIYKGMSSPNFSDHMTSDEAMIAAMVGMGYTTVSYIGDGVYKLEVTTGKKMLVADFVDGAEVVNCRCHTVRRARRIA